MLELLVSFVLVIVFLCCEQCSCWLVFYSLLCRDVGSSYFVGIVAVVYIKWCKRHPWSTSLRNQFAASGIVRAVSHYNVWMTPLVHSPPQWWWVVGIVRAVYICSVFFLTRQTRDGMVFFDPTDSVNWSQKIFSATFFKVFTDFVQGFGKYLIILESPLFGQPRNQSSILSSQYDVFWVKIWTNEISTNSDFLGEFY